MLAGTLPPRPQGWEIISAALAMMLIGIAAMSVNLGLTASDPRLLYAGSWRIANAHATQMRKTLIRSMLLASLALAWAAVLVAALLAQGYAPENPVLLWTGHIAWTGALAMCAASALLPWCARTMRHQHLEDAIDERRQGATQDQETPNNIKGSS